MTKALLTAVATIWVAMTFTFILIRQIPGDVLHNYAVNIQNTQGIPYDQARELAKLQINWDPDKPISQQYLHYVSSLAQGELGNSTNYRIPVSALLWAALPWTAFITLSAALLSFAVGVSLGL